MAKIDSAKLDAIKEYAALILSTLIEAKRSMDWTSGQLAKLPFILKTGDSKVEVTIQDNPEIKNNFLVWVKAPGIASTIFTYVISQKQRDRRRDAEKIVYAIFKLISNML